jgi:hypothetical protein
MPYVKVCDVCPAVSSLGEVRRTPIVGIFGEQPRLCHSIH